MLRGRQTDQQGKSKQKHLNVIEWRLIKVSIYISSRCPAAFDLTHFRSFQITSFFLVLCYLFKADVVGGESVKSYSAPSACKLINKPQANMS